MRHVIVLFWTVKSGKVLEKRFGGSQSGAALQPRLGEACNMAEQGACLTKILLDFSGFPHPEEASFARNGVD